MNRRQFSITAIGAALSGVMRAPVVTQGVVTHAGSGTVFVWTQGAWVDLDIRTVLTTVQVMHTGAADIAAEEDRRFFDVDHTHEHTAGTEAC